MLITLEVWDNLSQTIILIIEKLILKLKGKIENYYKL